MNLFSKNGKISEEVMFDSISFGKKTDESQKKTAMAICLPHKLVMMHLQLLRCTLLTLQAQTSLVPGKRDTLQN